MSDNINPDHYKRLPAEAIEIIEAMIAGAPDNKAAYLHGQAAKYDLRLWEKGESLEDYLADLGKHIWYALRLESHLLELIEKQKADEQQKASNLQSLKDHPFGKIKEPAIKQPTTTEPPDGWRWLEVGEKFFLGDTTVNSDGTPYMKTSISKQYCESWKCQISKTFIRRNRFEVGEKVIDCRAGVVFTVQYCNKEHQIVFVDGVSVGIESKHLAPYIGDAKPTVEVSVEVTGEVKNPLGCPDGWRWLEVGEVIRKGDKQVKGDAVPLLWIGTPCCGEEFILRRNRFEVGEKVVRVFNGVVYKVVRILSMGYQLESEFCAEVILHGKDLAPYIEETT